MLVGGTVTWPGCIPYRTDKSAGAVRMAGGYALWILALAVVMVTLWRAWQDITRYPGLVVLVTLAERTEEAEGIIRRVFRQYFWSEKKWEIVIATGENTFPIAVRLARWGDLGTVIRSRYPEAGEERRDAGGRD